MGELPSGTVTFLFTDIEGSTQRWQQHPRTMPTAVARHERLISEAIEANGGGVFKLVGDAVCAAFPDAVGAVEAALTAQRALYAEPWGATGPLRVRMGLHTGIAHPGEGDYAGGPLNRVARLMSAGHGGQVLLSGATAEVVADHLPTEVHLRDMGTHQLKDLYRPEHIFQLVTPDLPADFSPLKTEASLPPYPGQSPATPTPVPAPAITSRFGRTSRRIQAGVALLLAMLLGATAGNMLATRRDAGPTPTVSTTAASAELLTALADVPPDDVEPMLTVIALEMDHFGYSGESLPIDSSFALRASLPATGPAVVGITHVSLNSGESVPAEALPGPVLIFNQPGVVFAGEVLNDYVPQLWVGGEVAVLRAGGGATPGPVAASRSNDYVSLRKGDAVVVPAGVPFAFASVPDDVYQRFWLVGIFPGDSLPEFHVAYPEWYVWGEVSLPATGPIEVVLESLVVADDEHIRLDSGTGALLFPFCADGPLEDISFRFTVAGGPAYLSNIWFGGPPGPVAPATPVAPGVETAWPPPEVERVLQPNEPFVPPPCGLFAPPGTTVTLRATEGDEGDDILPEGGAHLTVLRISVPEATH